MSQTKVFSPDRGKALRRDAAGGNGQGCGGSKHLYVGRDNSGTDRIYWSLLRFAHDWSNVGQIVSATLVLYSEWDAVMPTPGTSDSPRIYVRRATSTWTEGNNADGDFDASDFDTASATTSDQREVAMAKAADGLNRIDITAMMEDWAPSTVKRRNGSPGGGAANHGVRLDAYATGSGGADRQWAGASEDYTADVTKRPTIELEYEYGATTPSTPTNLTPSGSVANLDAFEGDFADVDSDDTLDASNVQVYTNPQSGTGEESNDRITSTAHGLAVNTRIVFTSLTGGTGLTAFTGYYVKAVPTADTFTVSTTVGGAVVNITVDYSALQWAKILYDETHVATSSERALARFSHVPSAALPVLTRGSSYRWRARVRDSEAIWSAWTSLTSFTVTNNDPTAVNLTPTTGSDFDSLDGVLFSGDFSDVDGDGMSSYQIQLGTVSNFSSGIQWDTGRIVVATNATGFAAPYSGPPLAAGTYYWRARVWDVWEGVSGWTSAVTLVLNEDFETEAGQQGTVAIRRQVPWRILIKEMAFNAGAGSITGESDTDVFVLATHGLVSGQPIRFTSITGGTGLSIGTTYTVVVVDPNNFQLTDGTGSFVNITSDLTASSWTKVTTRGPGNTVAVLEDAMSVGASLMYNSPGEMHFTLPKDHPQIGVIEPKQTHYSIQFFHGDGWREVFAGLMWDYDATENDVVFYGLDYLALYDYVMDERYDPSNPDKSTDSGGSKYVAKTISHIVSDQITRAKALANSPVGFIDVGSIATMSDVVTVYSTYAPTLNFLTGLLDSHRQGASALTRLQVRPKTGGGYEAVVTDAEPVTKDNLRLSYGEFVQGYRVVPFGDGWGTRANLIGRARNGVAVMYKTAQAPGIQEAIWGRYAQANFIDGVADENDLQRRANRHAVRNAKLGRNLGLGVRSGMLSPRDGYDVTNAFPVAIDDGVVDTEAFGSGYWVCYGIAWEASDQQEQVTILTLLPREDTTAPDGDITGGSPISPQSEWQIGWEPPDPLEASSLYFLDQTTGIVYVRDPDTETYSALDSPGGMTNPALPLPPEDLAGDPAIYIDADGKVYVRLLVTWTLV